MQFAVKWPERVTVLTGNGKKLKSFVLFDREMKKNGQNINEKVEITKKDDKSVDFSRRVCYNEIEFLWWRASARGQNSRFRRLLESISYG